MLIDIHSKLPLDDSKVYIKLFTCIQNLIESLTIEEMTNQADCETLNAMATLTAIIFLG